MGHIVYEYRRKTKNDSQAKVPWLQFKGHWLDQAGFGIDTPVTIRVMEGCLVLTSEQKAQLRNLKEKNEITYRWGNYSR